MDIKLVKNFEEGMYIPVNREILLQIIDDNRRLEQFNGKHIFLFNPANNERFEILPEVPKFNVTKIYYGSEERDYFVFTSAKMINEHDRLHFTGIRFHCRRHLSYIHRLFLQTDSENRIISKFLYWHRIFVFLRQKMVSMATKTAIVFCLKM